MSSTFETFVKRTPAIVEDKQFGLKVRLEAQRCITYAKLALSAQTALSKPEVRSSSAEQPTFADVVPLSQLPPSLQNCEQILSNLMQDAYTRHLSGSAGKPDVARIPDEQQAELLSAFKGAKEQLQSYVSELDNLLAKQQPEQLPVFTKPQSSVQQTISIPSSHELERMLTEKYAASGIRLGKAPETSVAAAMAKAAAAGFGNVPQPSPAPHLKAVADKGSAAAATTTSSSSRWQLATLTPKDHNAVIQLTLKGAAMQAAISPQPPAASRPRSDMPQALGRGFGAMAARTAQARTTVTGRTSSAAKSVAPGFRPMPRPVAPVAALASSLTRSVDPAASVGQASLASHASATSVSTIASTPSSPYERLQQPAASALLAQMQQMQFQQQQPQRQGPIRLLAKPLDSPIQKICSVSLSPFAIQMKPQATKPAGELLQQLQSMRNQEEAWSCRVTWMVEVAKGLEVMHRHNVVHGCVTADNVLLSSSQSLGSASFDSMDAADEALWSDPTQLHAQISMMQAYIDVMSPRLSRPIEFSPPELLMKGEALSDKSDVYTFGLFMMQLMTGWAPAKHETDRELSKAVHDGHKHLRKTQLPIDPALIVQATNFANFRSPKIAALLQNCLRANPEQRPTASELVKTLLEETPGEEGSSSRS